MYNIWKDIIENLANIEKVHKLYLKWFEKVSYLWNNKITRYFPFEKTKNYVGIDFVLELVVIDRQRVTVFNYKNYYYYHCHSCLWIIGYWKVVTIDN